MEKMDIDMEPASSGAPSVEPEKKTASLPGTSNIMAAAGTVPSVTISLHPLVIMNISEHWTRIRAQAQVQKQVYGALIGKQKGRNIEVLNSFELKINEIGEEISINHDYYKTKEEQYKQVFSDLDFIGWYTTGEGPTDKEIKIHKQICVINECPILLQVNPITRNVDQLPVKLFESLIDVVQGEATMLFVPLTYTLATEEAERLGVDHVARMSTNETGEKSVVAEHLVAQHSAIKMLYSRIKLVLNYIKEVESGNLPLNQEILREIYSMSQRLPVVRGLAFRNDYYTQSNDVGLVAFLGILTKGCNDINHFVNKFNVLYDRQGMGRRMRGIYY